MTVCVLLAGLFLMHGSGLSAGGCHGMTATPSAMGGMVGMTARPAPAPAVRDGSVPAERIVPAAGTGGTLCVATVPRDRAGPVAGPAPALAVADPGVPRAGRPARCGAARRRGPPGGGRDVLARTCVART